MSELALEHEFVEGSPTVPALLLLHGTGGSPTDILSLGKELCPASPMLAPAGQVSERGAARWFRRHAEGVFDTEDVIFRAGQLADFIVEARKRYGLNERRLVAVGFSNGANIAAAVVLLHPEVLTEAVLFAAMLPVPEAPRHDLSATRVFMANGRQDPMAPSAPAQELVTVLRERGADVTEHWHSGGHQITVDGLAAAKEWLSVNGHNGPHPANG
ncbi:alpha/beta hydrolase [Saccharomonospora viridis]|jgi:phospholipase/carboxylesterase|uniref:Phospholipase n=1 Tax=Saccharomonospora viridis TaxID=1852 RepID=A0A837DCZ3_9PSEU|nr:alpha/beta hydrolase [Saccharomonospora viridis]KHF44244.1 phospholipase [Saccharomonospora viridis]SFP60083.1 phospholipase/carboxylesterase [Saccharomonospora viridis]